MAKQTLNNWDSGLDFRTKINDNFTETYSHTEDVTNNPHNVTKAQVGLGNVPDLDTTNAVNNEHTHSNKTLLDTLTDIGDGTQYLSDDGTYKTVSWGGDGDVSWPTSSTDSAVALFDWTTWKIIKDSGQTIVTSLWNDNTTIPTSKAVADAIWDAGGWDMLKSIYDTDDSGIVDDSEKLGWKLPADYELTANKVVAFQSTPTDTAYPSEKLVKDSLDGKADTSHTHTSSDITDLNTDNVSEWTTNLYYTETRVSANTDVSANTSARHTHSNQTILDWIANAPVETITAWTNITVTRSGNEVTIDSTASGGGWWIETVKIAGEQIAWTKFFEYNADWDKTVWNVKISLEVANSWADFIVKAYKNWTDLTKDITIADGGWTAVNGRYKASLDLAETLVADDVFELKINQVGSSVSGSEFVALININ